MGVLVGEHGHAAVLRLDRVVGHPQAGVADLGAAVLVFAGPTAGRFEERLRAVRPDGVLALERVAVGLVAAGVNDLEVVDVAVGLVESPSPSKSLRSHWSKDLTSVGDLRVGAALGCWSSIHAFEAVADQVLAVPADDARTREAVAAAVAGLVVGHLDPVGDLAVDAVATR